MILIVPFAAAVLLLIGVCHVLGHAKPWQLVLLAFVVYLIACQ